MRQTSPSAGPIVLLSSLLLVISSFTVQGQIPDSGAQGASKAAVTQSVSDGDDVLIEEDEPAAKAAPVVKESSVREVSPAAQNGQVTDSTAKPSVTGTAAPASSPKAPLAGSQAATTVVSPKSASAAPVLEKDEELILEGGEEDLLDQVKPSNAQAKPASAAGDTLAPAPSSEQNIAKPVADSGANSSEQVQKAPEEVAPIDTAKTVEAVVPVRVEQAKSVNFAKNLKEYRSPKMAMVLSLLVPGAGQLYSRNFWKAPIFAAVEAAFITAGVSYSMKGKQKREDAHRFADAHFKMDSFAVYIEDLYKFISERDSEVVAKEEVGAFFIDTPYVYKGRKGDGFYTYINDNTFVHGWDDCEPSLDAIKEASSGGKIPGEYGEYVVLSAPYYYRVNRISNGKVADSDKSLLGYSDNMNRFSDMMSLANKQYRTAGTLFAVLIVNHIASAVDAGISAKTHNDQLLGNETVWNRINVEQQYVNTGSETVPGYALSVRF